MDPQPSAPAAPDPREEAENELMNKMEKLQDVLDRGDLIPWIELKDDAVWRWLRNVRRFQNDFLEEIDKYSDKEVEEALKEWNVPEEEKNLKVLYSIPCVLSCIKPVEKTEPDRIGPKYKLLEWFQKLDSILNDDDVKKFNSFVHAHDQQSATCAGIIELGAQKSDKDYLINQYLFSEDVSNRVISIQGSEGSGKTTVARLVFDDKRVKDSFQVRTWEHDESVIKDAAKSTDQIHGRRFLLVFDGVTDVNFVFSNRYKILSLLNCGAPGSIIMITTREDFSTIVHDVHVVRPLSSSDCWSILKQAALSGNRELQRQVGGIGRQFGKRCEGSPLVAKSVGDYLKFKATAQEWEDVLSDEVWQLKTLGMLTRIRNPDSFYKHVCLPAELKKCFSYCAVFPKDSQLSAERLVALWAALCYTGMEEKGYDVVASLEEKSMFTDVRRSIHKNKITSCKFDEAYYLVASCVSTEVTMLQQKKMLDSDSETEIQQSLVIVSPCVLPTNLFRRLRDVSALVLSSCKLEQLSREIGSLIHLRFLDLSGNPLELLPETIGELKCLESLHVHSCYLLLSLPESIGKLSSLRHLRINYTTDKLHDLPQGFEKLVTIKTMDVFRVGGTYKNIGKLEKFINLVDIRIAIHGKVRFSDADLQSKTKMENLELCFVGKGRDEETAQCIKELVPPGKLKMLLIEDYHGLIFPSWILHRSLINNLTRLSLRSAVHISYLPALWKLSCLEFLWLYDMPNIKHIGCEFFGLPTIQQQQSSGYDHEGEEISDSSEDEDQEITDEESVAAFRRLVTLRIEYLENWEIWEDAYEHYEVQIKVMPLLKELIIANCPKLRGKPLRVLKHTPWFELRLFKELDEYSKRSFIGGFHIRRRNEIHVGGTHDSSFRVPEDMFGYFICIFIHGEVNFSDADFKKESEIVDMNLRFVEAGRDQEKALCIEELARPPYLKTLRMDNYPGLGLPEWILADSLINKLERLIVTSSPNISSFPSLWKLSSLEFLFLFDISSLKCLSLEFFGCSKTGKNEETAFPRLKTLGFEYMENWETWEDVDVVEADKKEFKVMPALEELIIAECPKLRGKPLHILRDTPWYKKQHMFSASKGKTSEIEPVQD